MQVVLGATRNVNPGRCYEITLFKACGSCSIVAVPRLDNSRNNVNFCSQVHILKLNNSLYPFVLDP
jgi:hypothetical protein